MVLDGRLKSGAASIRASTQLSYCVKPASTKDGQMVQALQFVTCTTSTIRWPRSLTSICHLPALSHRRTEAVKAVPTGSQIKYPPAISSSTKATLQERLCLFNARVAHKKDFKWKEKRRPSMADEMGEWLSLCLQWKRKNTRMATLFARNIIGFSKARQLIRGSPSSSVYARMAT